MIVRDQSGRLRPGSSSLNPGGRPKTPERVRAMLEGLTEQAVLALEEALNGDDPKLRMIAAQEVLNRALGRPHTTASVEVKTADVSAAHIAALNELTALAKASKHANTIEAEVVPEPRLIPHR